jgi:hypothetical protein
MRFRDECRHWLRFRDGQAHCLRCGEYFGPASLAFWRAFFGWLLWRHY